MVGKAQIVKKVADPTPQIVEKVADPTPQIVEKVADPTLQILGKKVAGPGEESNCSAKNAKVNIDHEIVKIVGKPQEMTINIEKDKFNKDLLLQAKESIEKVRSQSAPEKELALNSFIEQFNHENPVKFKQNSEAENERLLQHKIKVASLFK